MQKSCLLKVNMYNRFALRSHVSLKCTINSSTWCQGHIVCPLDEECVHYWEKMRNWISLGTCMCCSSNWQTYPELQWLPVPLKGPRPLPDIQHLHTLCRTDCCICNILSLKTVKFETFPFVCKFMRLALTSTGSLLLWYFPGVFWPMISSWRWVSGVYWLSQK